MNENAQKWADIAGTSETHKFIATGWYQSEKLYKMSGIYSVGRLISAILEAGKTPSENLTEKTILEIGCGTGRETEFLAQIFGKVVAIDCAHDMIEKAMERVKYKNVAWSVSDGDSLKGIANSSADIVYSFVVFQHMKRETILNYFSEVGRVLKPGGYFFFQLGCYPEHKEPAAFNDVAHWTESELKAGCAGLKIVKIELSDHFGLHIFKK
jgi:ubiquinone/menaquinone biosynthesis C-methylase UbiE